MTDLKRGDETMSMLSRSTVVPRSASPALVVLAMLLVAAIPAAASPAAAETPLALKGLDPVLLVAGREVAGDPALAVDHAGLRYLFAGADSRDRFTADPDRYAIQGDGSCPVVSSATADPSIFAVFDGKIFAFATPACVEKFRLAPEYYAQLVTDPDEEPTAAPPTRTVAILLYDGVELLDFAGAGEVFAATGKPVFEVFTVAATKAPVTSRGFVTVTPQHGFADAPAIDVLVVPGGGVTPLLNDEAAIAWIAAAGKRAELVLSVSTGALVLARAGLLDGLPATSHQFFLGQLAELAPTAEVVEGRRFVDAGRVITAAGMATGIDAALYAVEKLVGPATAGGVARYMEQAWTPGGDGESGAAPSR
jgi:putative intracellular protease/amidase/YHS domain-containing protein